MYQLQQLILSQGFSDGCESLLLGLVIVYSLATLYDWIKLPFILRDLILNMDGDVKVLNTLLDITKKSVPYLILILQYGSFVQVLCSIKFDKGLSPPLVLWYIFFVTCSILYAGYSSQHAKQMNQLMKLAGVGFALSIILKILHQVPG